MTENIRTTDELRRAYSWLRLLEENLGTFDDPRPIRGLIRDQKRAIRAHLARQEARLQNAPRLVRDDGINGGVVHLPLPEGIRTAEQADQWFRDNEYLEYQWGPYDCTGQLFTRWYKIHHRPDGRFWAYHSVGRDV